MAPQQHPNPLNSTANGYTGTVAFEPSPPSPALTRHSSTSHNSTSLPTNTRLDCKSKKKDTPDSNSSCGMISPDRWQHTLSGPCHLPVTSPSTRLLYRYMDVVVSIASPLTVKDGRLYAPRDWSMESSVTRAHKAVLIAAGFLCCPQDYVFELLRHLHLG